MKELIQKLIDPSHPLSATNTSRHHTIFTFPSSHFIKKRNRELSPRTPKRMAQCNGPTIDIEFTLINPEFFHYRHSLHGKSFVKFG